MRKFMLETENIHSTIQNGTGCISGGQSRGTLTIIAAARLLDELLSKTRGLLSRMEEELVNTPVGGPSRMRGLPDSINPNKPPRIYRDVIQREDRQEWAEAY